METVESIERKMRLQRLLLRFFLFMLLIALCFFVGWLISQSTYEGLNHEVFDLWDLRKPLNGYA